MSTSQQWHINRIIGSVAEAACRCHFEALGYKVEATGIEHIAPAFAELTACHPGDLGNYGARTMALRVMPDFLISRAGAKVEAQLVEAKFRSEATFDELIAKDLFVKYQPILDQGMNVLIYLVTHRYRMTAMDSWIDAQNGNGVFVHLCFFSKSRYADPARYHTNGMISVGASIFEKGLYLGTLHGANFNTVYAEIVRPALKRVFG
jgi:hypothetical protein